MTVRCCNVNRQIHQLRGKIESNFEPKNWQTRGGAIKGRNGRRKSYMLSTQDKGRGGEGWLHRRQNAVLCRAYCSSAKFSRLHNCCVPQLVKWICKCHILCLLLTPDKVRLRVSHNCQDFNSQRYYNPKLSGKMRVAGEGWHVCVWDTIAKKHVDRMYARKRDRDRDRQTGAHTYTNTKQKVMSEGAIISKNNR